MTLTDKELLDLNEKGFIPGPKEDEKAFIRRVKETLSFAKDPNIFFEKLGESPPFSLNTPVAYHDWEWPVIHLKKLYDISPNWLVGYYENQKLSFTQGAQAWIFENHQQSRFSLLQFRKALKKGSFLKIYSREEILSHEAVHAVRVAFDEPQTEEVFAYMTAKSFFRRKLGPLIRKPQEVFYLLALLFFSMLFQQLSYLYDLFALHAVFRIIVWVSCAYIGWGFFRLTKIHWRISRAYRKLKGILQEDRLVRAVLFRLTDQEIDSFSRMNLEKIKNYSLKQREKQLRWKILWLAYFQPKICLN